MDDSAAGVGHLISGLRLGSALTPKLVSLSPVTTRPLRHQLDGQIDGIVAMIGLHRWPSAEKCRRLFDLLPRLKPCRGIPFAVGILVIPHPTANSPHGDSGSRALGWPHLGSGVFAIAGRLHSQRLLSLGTVLPRDRGSGHRPNAPPHRVAVRFKPAQGCFVIALAGDADAFAGTVW